MPKLLLVDAHAYLHRAFHAIPLLSASNGQPTNAVMGFTKTLLKLLQEQKPDYCVVCFDAPGPVFRSEIDPQYKANRKETDAALRSQFPIARELVQAMNLAMVDDPGYEADDYIATLALRGAKENMDVLIVSGDKDILQLVNDKILVLNEGKGVLFNAEKVKEKWGVAPNQVADLLALMGDSSDNVPGVAGIGEKTAAKLIQEFGSLDAILQKIDNVPERYRVKILDHKEVLKRGKALVTLSDQAPCNLTWDQTHVPQNFPQSFLEFLQKYEFHHIAKALPSLAEKTNFKEPQKTVSRQTDYKTILDSAQWQEFLAQIKDAKFLALDIETNGLDLNHSQVVGLSLCAREGEAVYVAFMHQYLGAPAQLNAEQTVKELYAALKTSGSTIIGHNLKFDITILTRYGFAWDLPIFDTMIAAYSLEAARNSYGLKALAQEILGEEMTHYDELISSAGKSASIEDIEVEKAANYACADADMTFRLFEVFSAQFAENKTAKNLFDTVEMPLVTVLSAIETRGILIDENYLLELEKSFAQEMQQIEKQAHVLAAQEFNLNSPKQLAFILFEKLGLPPVKKTKTGFSTDEEVLSTLSAQHELPQILLRHREVSKLQSTYVQGLLKTRDKVDGRVHTSLSQTGTATGRLSSSEPNLQNIPIRSEYGRKIRRAFIAAPGNVFLSADYSQIDLRAMAHLSQDPVLCQAFLQDADIHRATAAQVFGIEQEAVSSQQRNHAKAINFGIIYGQQAFGLAQTLGIDMGKAKNLIEQYFEKYRGVKTWIEKTKQRAHFDGYVDTLLGRRRTIATLQAKNVAARQFAERIATNTPVQGTSSDIIKMAMIQIFETLKMQPQLNAYMLLQVHDDLLFEVQQNQLTQLAKIVKQKMESAVKLNVPLKVEMKSGANWSQMESYTPPC